jgi:hypothetical protein
MTVHTSWDKGCNTNGGVVSVVTRPEHGKLSNRVVALAIPNNKFGGDNHCLGQPTKGFEVYYTPTRGFHGADSFTLQITIGSGATRVDRYAVMVK